MVGEKVADQSLATKVTDQSVTMRPSRLTCLLENTSHQHPTPPHLKNMSNWQLPTLQTQYTKRHQREAQQCLRQQTRAISLRGRQLKNAAPKFGNLWATEAMLFASQWQVGCTCGCQEQFMFFKIVIMDTMNKRIVLENRQCATILKQILHVYIKLWV